MNYSRQQYFDFLERELIAQNDDFLTKVQSPAIHLLEVDGEMFLGKFLGVKNGQAILKMSNKRGLPRKGAHLNALVLPSDLRNYHNWNKLTYGDLTKQQDCNCELACVWYGKSDEDNFSLVGFTGLTTHFFERIKSVKGIILVLGPQVPPSEMLFNLQKIVQDTSCQQANDVLDADFEEKPWQPIALDARGNLVSFMIQQLNFSNTAILQGPPGTGKTTLIAGICQELIQQGKSVLVSAMTNRALIEIAAKNELSEAVKSGLVRKTNLTLDEAEEVIGLKAAKDFCPISGQLLLSTNYITSGAAVDGIPECGFDYVIMDEASQAILPMFAAASRLGVNQLWVGDIKQLAPVSLVHEKVLQKYNFGGILDGFKTLSTQSSVPNYQLTASYRLTNRSAKYTNFFYDGSLKSKNEVRINPQLPKLFHRDGGPSLITMDLPQMFAPNEILAATVMTVSAIYKACPNANVAVLSCFKETAKHIHRALLEYGLLHKNLLVDTIARVQGLTTDFTIFVIPNTSLIRSLEPRLFNVATSRALMNTIIIADTNIVRNCRNENVRRFMATLENDREAHIHLNSQADLQLIEQTQN